MLLAPDERRRQQRGGGEQPAACHPTGIDQCVDQDRQRRGKQQRARVIERRVFLGRIRRHPPRGDGHRYHGKRRDQPENGWPAPLVDEPAAEHRTDGGGQGGRTGPCADSAATFLLAEVAADQRQARGHQQSTAQTLHATRGNQQRQRRRERASERAEPEHRVADDEDAA